MSFKHKYSYVEKEKIIIEYLNGTYGFRQLCDMYSMSQTALQDWIRLYNTFGFEGLKTGNKTTRYSSQLKQSAVNDYLNRKNTIPEILKKYKIKSGTQLKRWIKKYNGHEELKASGTGGYTIMTKGRKTTFEERVGIVQYCIAHEHNYAETAEKYQVSYQQTRNYVVKYEADGVDGLQDRRGKRKSEDEMTELERLRAENKILRAEKERAEMEASFLKKLEEIERRRG